MEPMVFGDHINRLFTVTVFHITEQEAGDNIKNLESVLCVCAYYFESPLDKGYFQFVAPALLLYVN